MSSRCALTVLIPTYFEEECIERCIAETLGVLDASFPHDYELLFVDDGSADRTVPLLRDAAARNPRVRVVQLSYNHGKAGAITAGIHHAAGDRIVMMDPDLQNPPSEIPALVAKLDEGHDVVFGIRNEEGDSFMNTLYSRAFWALLNRATGLNVPSNLAVMRAFNRRFADKFREYGEASRFIEGIFMHIGMRRATMVVRHQERLEGTSKFTFKRKVTLAVDAMLDFSSIPLQFATRLGLTFVALSMLAAFAMIVLRLFFIDFQLGWPSAIITILFGIGTQTFFTGVVGAYVGKIYQESKRRPLFSVRQTFNIEDSTSHEGLAGC